MSKIINKMLWAAAVLLAGLLVPISPGAGLPCTNSISPASRTHGNGDATNTVVITASAPDCAWTVVNSNGWITIVSSTTGLGSATVTYTVDANPAPAWRTGNVVVASQVFTIAQNPANCSYSISPSIRTNGYGAVTGNVSLTTSAGCTWSASSADDWIGFASATNGVGSATISYALEANPSLNLRTGLVVIAGREFTVVQRGAVSTCPHEISPDNRSHGYGASAGTVLVTDVNACGWTTVNPHPWITITSAGSGTGNGSVSYIIGANPSALPRMGVLTIGDRAFTITQAGVSCSYSISPSSRTHGKAAATNTITVTTSNDCSWSVVNANTWVTLVSGPTGSGGGVVMYAIAANQEVNDRSGVLLIDGKTFTLTQRGSGCPTSISPGGRSHGYGAASNHITVTAVAACSWVALNTNAWITIVAGAGGVGNSAVGYLVEANPGGAARSGVITIGEQAFSISQAGNCSYDVTPGNRTHGNGAATNTASLTTGAACVWSLVNTSGWIAILSPASGTGSATVTYRVDPNADFADRTAVVVIGGQPFSLTQRGVSCAYSISPSTRSHGYAAATNMVTMTTGSNCLWTVSKTNDWITILSPNNGQGTGTVMYTVAANTEFTPRLGVVMIDGLPFTVTQAEYTCGYSISPTMRSHGYSAATNTVTMTTGANCPWTVTLTNDWITILSATSGQGAGTVTYAVSANAELTSRSAVVMMDGLPFTVSQAEFSCSYSLSPALRSHGYSAATNSVTVTAGAICPWTVTTTNDWLTILSAASGQGTGTVTYAVDLNPNFAARSGVVMIDGQSFTVTQTEFACAYKLSPTNRMHGFGAIDDFVKLTAGTNCAWTVVNTNEWIQITSGPSGFGTTNIGYAVTGNFGIIPRTGVVMVADQILTLTQRPMTNGFMIETITSQAGQVQLRLVGGPAGVWELQGSSDLQLWDKLLNLTNVTGVVEINDPVGLGINRRFYRAVLPP